MRRISMFLGCLLAAGCGGGGGGGQANPTAGPGVGLGERGLPGYTVRVERLGTALAGATVTVRAVITADPGQAAPLAVAAALQAEAPASWTDGMPSAGAWTWTFTVPEGADQRVWVRVVDADGNSAESGSEDFALP